MTPARLSVINFTDIVLNSKIFGQYIASQRACNYPNLSVLAI